MTLHNGSQGYDASRLHSDGPSTAHPYASSSQSPKRPPARQAPGSSFQSIPELSALPAKTPVPAYGQPPRERSNIQGASCIEVKPSPLSTVPLRKPLKGTLEYDELQLKMPDPTPAYRPHAPKSPLSSPSKRPLSWLSAKRHSHSARPSNRSSSSLASHSGGGGGRASVASSSRPASAISIRENMPGFLRPVSVYGSADDVRRHDRQPKYRHSRLLRHAAPGVDPREEQERQTSACWGWSPCGPKPPTQEGVH